MEGFRAYRRADGLLVATLDQAGKDYTQVTVPYKKADLLAFINEELEAEARVGQEPVVPAIPEPATPQAVEPAEPGDSIYRSISQTETQQVDRICGIIFNAPPVSLSRFARSVSMGYVRLSQEGK